MATTRVYTEADLQKIINTRYNQESTPPGTDDEDYLLRRELLNQFIQDWQNETGVIWEALRTSTADASTGAVLTITSPTTKYATPTEFCKLGGKVYLYGTDGLLKRRVPVIKAIDAGDYRSRNVLRAYVTGNPRTGYFINFTAVNTDMTGWTMAYDYQLFATIFSSPTSVTEVTDPLYLAFKVLSELHRPSRVALATEYDNDATSRMETMILDNLMNTPGEANELNQGWSYLDNSSRSFFDA